WVAQFFVREHYFFGNKVLVPMGIFLGFEAIFCAAAVLTPRKAKLDATLLGSALVIAGLALLWAFGFLSFRPLGHRPVLLCSYVFLADALLLAFMFAKQNLARLSTLAGLAVFAFLAIWTSQYLRAQNLYIALGVYFVFALLHSFVPLVWQRKWQTSIGWSSHLFPALSLLLILVPIFNLPDVSF